MNIATSKPQPPIGLPDLTFAWNYDKNRHELLVCGRLEGFVSLELSSQSELRNSFAWFRYSTCEEGHEATQAEALQCLLSEYQEHHGDAAFWARLLVPAVPYCPSGGCPI